MLNMVSNGMYQYEKIETSVKKIGNVDCRSNFSIYIFNRYTSKYEMTQKTKPPWGDTLLVRPCN